MLVRSGSSCSGDLSGSCGVAPFVRVGSLGAVVLPGFSLTPLFAHSFHSRFTVSIALGMGSHNDTRDDLGFGSTTMGTRAEDSTAAPLLPHTRLTAPGVLEDVGRTPTGKAAQGTLPDRVLQGLRDARLAPRPISPAG